MLALLFTACVPDLGSLAGGPEEAGAVGGSAGGMDATGGSSNDGGAGSAAVEREAAPADAREAEGSAGGAGGGKTSDASLSDRLMVNDVGPDRRSSFDASVEAAPSLDGWKDAEAAVMLDAHARDASMCAGSALHLSHTGYLEVPRIVGDDFTLEAWIKPDEPSVAGASWWQGTPLFWADLPITVGDFAVVLLNDRLVMNTGNPDTSIESSAVVTPGQWAHVAVTRERTTGRMQLFINGVFSGTTFGGTSALDGAPKLTIGADPNGVTFAGSIDEVRVWRTVRTPAQISDNMRMSLNGTEAGLVGNYTFDEDSGSKVLDYSSAVNDGTFVGSYRLVPDDSPLCPAVPSEAGADANNEAGVDSAADAPHRPAVFYGFETGLEGWVYDASLQVAASTAHADTGVQSLAVTMSEASFKSVYLSYPPAGLNPGKFTFRFYLPTGTRLDVLQPFDQVGNHAPAWSWKGMWFSPEQISTMPRDVWQTITVQVPTLADGVPREEPFNSVGVQISGNGTVYIDSVAW